MYAWHYIGKQEVFVPYNDRATDPDSSGSFQQAALSNSFPGRWEKHRVLVLDGTLRRGESNLLHRRRFYVDEALGLIMLGEGFDISGAMVQCYFIERISTSPLFAQGCWHSL